MSTTGKGLKELLIAELGQSVVRTDSFASVCDMLLMKHGLPKGAPQRTVPLTAVHRQLGVVYRADAEAAAAIVDDSGAILETGAYQKRLRDLGAGQVAVRQDVIIGEPDETNHDYLTVTQRGWLRLQAAGVETVRLVWARPAATYLVEACGAASPLVQLRHHGTMTGQPGGSYWKLEQQPKGDGVPPEVLLFALSNYLPDRLVVDIYDREHGLPPQLVDYDQALNRLFDSSSFGPDQLRLAA